MLLLSRFALRARGTCSLLSSFQASIGSVKTLASSATAKMTEVAPSPFANSELDSTVGRPPPISSTSSSTSSTAKTFVLFHSPCPDGAFAALAAWLHFKAAGAVEERVRFVPHRVYEAMEVPTTPSPSAPPSSTPSSAPPPPPSSSTSSSSSSSPLASLTPADTVYLLDYSGPAGFPQALSKVAARVVVLDHHRTAAEQLGAVIEAKAWTKKENGEGKEAETPPFSNLEVLLDQDRSGATISAAHFNPQLTQGLTRAFAAIQDGDLWHWKLPDSKAFYAGLHSSGILDEKVTRTPLEMLEKLSQLDWEETVRRGAAEVEERDRVVAAEAEKAFEVELRGPESTSSPSSPSFPSFGRALAVEVRSDQAGLRSLLGNVLAARAKEMKEKGEGGGGKGTMRSVGVVAYREPGMNSSSSTEEDQLIKISLRSIGEDEDTTPVSQAHGGGGHRNASSFLMPAREFARWRK